MERLDMLFRRAALQRRLPGALLGLCLVGRCLGIAVGVIIGRQADGSVGAVGATSTPSSIPIGMAHGGTPTATEARTPSPPKTRTATSTARQLLTPSKVPSARPTAPPTAVPPTAPPPTAPPTLTPTALPPTTMPPTAPPTLLPTALPPPATPIPTVPPPAAPPSAMPSSRSSLHSVTTTTGVDASYQPRDRTSTFTTQERVYITFQIREAQPGAVVTFTCVSKEGVWWEGVDQIAAGGTYRGYFVLEPLPPGTYRGELAYKGELHTVSWEVREVPPTTASTEVPKCRRPKCRSAASD
jgi:hypothetical protein